MSRCGTRYNNFAAGINKWRHPTNGMQVSTHANKITTSQTKQQPNSHIHTHKQNNNPTNKIPTMGESCTHTNKTTTPQTKHQPRENHAHTQTKQQPHKQNINPTTTLYRREIHTVKGAN